MDLVADALSAGMPVEAALREVAAVLEAPPGQDLRAVAAALAWGLEDDAAWSVAPGHWTPAAQALALARRVGAPPVGLLRAAAEDERRRRARSAQKEAAALPVRLVIPLAVFFLPAFVLMTVLPVVLALAATLLPGS